MATWTTIPDSSLEPGKPVRSIDTLALRDNPIAISEGASGAPRNLDASLSTTVTADGISWVGARSAGAATGAVGTYAFLGETAAVTTNPGSTRAGSTLRYAGIAAQDRTFGDTGYGVASTIGAGGTPSGTWRAMGAARYTNIGGVEYYPATLWLRIA